jgi:hypothetical protein
MLWNVCNSLIISPTADARVSVGGLSALFLIQLPLSAASLRRGGMVL